MKNIDKKKAGLVIYDARPDPQTYSLI